MRRSLTKNHNYFRILVQDLITPTLAGATGAAATGEAAATAATPHTVTARLEPGVAAVRLTEARTAEAEGTMWK